MSLTSLVAISAICSLYVGSLFNPLMGVLGYLVTYLLVSPYSWWCHPLYQLVSRPSFTAMAFLCLGCLLHFQNLNWRFSKKEIAFYLFALTAWVVTHYFGVLIDEGTIKFLTKMMKMFVFLFLFFRVVDDWKSLNTVVWGIIACGVFLGYQGHVSGNLSTGRIESLGGSDFSEANSLGSFLMCCVVLLGFKLFQAPLWKKAIMAFGIALMLNIFIMSQSRAVLIGIVCMVPIVFIKMPKQYAKQLWVFAVLALIMFSLLVNDSFLTRMETVGDTVGGVGKTDPLFEKESVDRLDFWIASVSIFKDHPMGIGVNNFANIVPEYDPRNPGMDPHNTYVLCYSEIGIVGFILFMYIIITSFWELRRVKKAANLTGEELKYRLLCISIIGVYIINFLGSMMTHSILYTEILWIYFALATCLETAIRNEIKVF